MPYPPHVSTFFALSCGNIQIPNSPCHGGDLEGVRWPTVLLYTHHGSGHSGECWPTSGARSDKRRGNMESDGDHGFARARRCLSPTIWDTERTRGFLLLARQAPPLGEEVMDSKSHQNIYHSFISPSNFDSIDDQHDQGIGAMNFHENMSRRQTEEHSW